MNKKISVFKKLEDLQRAAAELFIDACLEAVSSRGRFNAVLTGGRTPIGLHRMLASEPLRSRLDWSSVHLYWGDERCVGPDHSESNFGMARKTMLDILEIPEENIHPMKGVLGPEKGARHYEKLISEFSADKGAMIFDLIFLGIGTDGHTASLFPGSLAVNETSRWVAPVSEEESGGYGRITLTVPALNSASRVLFLIAGESKAEIAERLLSGDTDPALPASLIRPALGDLEILLDAGAAGLYKA